MKVIINLILSLIVFINLNATPQDSEILVYNNDTTWINYFPLEKLRKVDQTIDKNLNKYFEWSVSTNWRGYIGTWLIENDSLFLTSLETDFSHEKIDLSKIFDGSYLCNNKVYAFWYSEKINTDWGDFLGYEENLDSDIYEDRLVYSANLLCEVIFGKVINLEIKLKPDIEVKELQRRLELMKDTMTYMFPEEFPVLLTKGNYFKDLGLGRFSIQNEQLCECPKVIISVVIEKDGTISNEKIQSPDESDFCSKESLKIVDLMKKWKPGKQKEKPIRTKYNLIFNFQS